MSEPKQAQSPRRVPVAIKRMQLKNSSHFLQMRVSSVWMHLQPISWKMGKRRQMTATTPAWVRLDWLVLLMFMDLSSAEARAAAEQQVMGRQIHLKNPLKAVQVGQNSAFELLQHFTSPRKMATSTRNPATTIPKDRGKPRVQTRSGDEQKVRMLYWKLTKLVESFEENAVGYMASAKMYDICMKSRERKYCRKMKSTGTTRLRDAMEQIDEAAEQLGTTLFIAFSVIIRLYFISNQIRLIRFIIA